jgi:hypothetical protein
MHPSGEVQGDEESRHGAALVRRRRVRHRTGSICYSMEGKDVVLPPCRVVSGLCAAMSLDSTSSGLAYAQPHCISPSRHCCVLISTSFALSFVGRFSQDRYGAVVDGLERGPLLVLRLSYTDGRYVAHTTV